MHRYRVTKYDPRLRNPAGAYLVDEWTSRSDLGKAFSGVLFTEATYLKIEQAYIDAAIAFLNEANISALKVTCLENRGKVATAPQMGSTVEITELSSVLRSMLREEYWCKLESLTAFVHVGYDYYMYIGAPIECVKGSAIASSKGLFVENFKSPYEQSPA